MSVRVNLLPQEAADRQRASRANALMAGGFLLLILLVAGTWFFMNARVDDVEAELATEEQALQQLQAELAELDEYATLQERVDTAEEDLAVLLGSEVSLAGLLQDVAAVMPTDIELQSLDVAVNLASAPTLGDQRPPIGLATLGGRTLRGHAPGVERLLLELDKLGGLDDLFMTNSTLEENELVDGDVAAFTVEADLGPELFTGRYATGLPEVLR